MFLCLELIVSVVKFGICSAIRVHKAKNSQCSSQKGGLQPQTDEIQHLITAIQCCHQAKRDKAVSTYMESTGSYNLPFFLCQFEQAKTSFDWNVLRPYLLKNLLLIFMCESGSNYSLCSASTLIIYRHRTSPVSAKKRALTFNHPEGCKTPKKSSPRKSSGKSPMQGSQQWRVPSHQRLWQCLSYVPLLSL